MIGKRLNERYLILESIGGGGMANVYLARDIILDREVAVKMLRPEFSDDDEFIKRFHREAQSATSLAHPNVVDIYDVGEENGHYYIIMEYVKGKTLKQYIQQSGPVSVDVAISIMKQITSAISHAHENQIVHRDIKPHNILIDEYGTIKVTDFGIAMALSATTITQTNSVLGSVHYLSPEQARGGMANKKSDIYSLGIVLFELLSGRLPFSGESAVSIALKHLQSDVPSLKRWNSSIPQSVENIVLKATSKDPFNRYESADQMQDDLLTSLSPNRKDEERFVPPYEDGEVTKAIPVITDDRQMLSNDETIIHKSNLASNDFSETNKPKKTKKKKNKLFAFIFIISFILIGAIVTAFFVVPPLFKTEDISIPDVTGLDSYDAITQITDAGLTYDVKSITHETIPEGNIIRTEPEAGSVRKSGFKVILYKSSGKEKTIIENYVGKPFDKVYRKLEEEQDFFVRLYYEESPEPKGTIIEQEPTEGTKVVAEDTTVILIVSKGPKVEIPKLIGKSLEEVQKLYVENGDISLDIVEEKQYSAEYAKGLIIEQSIEPGIKVEKGKVIEVVLSKGPPPKRTTVNVEVELDPSISVEDRVVYVYVGDAENSMTDVYKTERINKPIEIVSFELIVPYNGEAQYKLEWKDGSFIEGDKRDYEYLQ